MATLEALQRQPGPSLRTRPPAPEAVAADENHVPLRPQRLGRRESRLGLRSIFGRSKVPARDIVVDGPPPSPNPPARSGGIRASIVEMSNWTYGQQPARSEVSLQSSIASRPLSIAMEEPGQTVQQQPKPSASARHPRATVATWETPPLFKAYPQAIRHATLPASILSTDDILRLSEKRAAGGFRDDSASVNPAADSTSKDKRKKKGRRSGATQEAPFEWTTKVYILTTSGCLLQYAGEGTFDRLPEKVLQLGKTSAAYASDVIPGRHWVIQVSPTVETDTATPVDSRSLLSRLPFRAAERRSCANNFLMVFESGEDMEAWLVALRREIEALGGKKSVSETGSPKLDENGASLRERPSQRTLVVRDPDRFSKTYSQEMSWSPTQESESSANVADPDAAQDQPSDDISTTTNSTISQDGRQLESLRDSATRLSVISSGQRTVVTSACSTPSSSPTVDSFPSKVDEPRPLRDSAYFEARPRPNAGAIIDRRKSLLTMGPFVDVNGQPSFRPQSIVASQPLGESMSPRRLSASPPPNFSVPQYSQRRFSHIKTASFELAQSLEPRQDEEPSRAGSRRRPPPTLRIARPLSMVADQPSPKGEVPARPATRHGEDHPPSPPGEDDAVPQLRFRSQRRAYPDAQQQRLSLAVPAPTQVAAHPQPRRLSSMGALRKQDHVAARMHNSTLAEARNLRSSLALFAADEPERCASSMDVYGSARSRSPPVQSQASKRASMYSILSDRSSQRGPSMDLPLPLANEPLPLPAPAPPPTIPLPPIPTSAGNNRLRIDMRSRSLSSRRSMPQLAGGPPPAPPPTCALPPIPQKMAIRI